MKLSEPPCIAWEMMCYKIIYFNFVNVWLIILTTWNFKMQAKLQFLDHQIVTSCICHSKSGLFTIYLKGNDMKIPNLENLEFYTCTLWDHNAKIVNYGLQEELMGANVCILVGIYATKWTTFDFMRNDVLENYLVQFL